MNKVAFEISPGELRSRGLMALWAGPERTPRSPDSFQHIKGHFPTPGVQEEASGRG